MKRLQGTIAKACIWLFFLALFAAAGPGTDFTAVASASHQEERQALELLNADRAQHGLPPLKHDARLAQVARNHARDMAENHFFSHTNLAGQSPFDRMDAKGISYIAAGENIAQHYHVPEMQAGWMNSPGHRANILCDYFTHVGIGLYRTADGELYGVQLFAGY